MQGSSCVTTIVFTDIEGSSRLWEEEGDRMSAALARHDILARAAVEDNRGVVVKMTGDGMFATFDDPADALEAVVALQRSLADATAAHGIALRLRSGVHTGAVERRGNDTFGTTVNRAARIMSAAHGGQVLLSQAAVDAIGPRLASPHALRDLGRVRLRDLATPEHVYQVLHPALRQDFPSLRSLESTPTNLPQQTTSFIGRERELAEAKALLGESRLLTLLGMGGLGKTRLSLQIGADVLDAYPDGVWFVDLAPIRDPALVESAAAQVLGIREEPGRALVQTLCAQLQSRKLLLILDNCEHLLGACAKLADALLNGTPEVSILATSREALRLRGEQAYPVLPMAAPDAKGGLESVLRSDAVQLFVERARLQKPAFAITDREAPEMAELCARLDGIPLALELAAARVRSLSLAEINTRLHDRFKLLVGGSRVALERQQTLRALVSWSYDLLTETEQLLLDRLSVFVGGFDLAAAETVCGADPVAPEDVIDLLSSLVDKSLVMVEQGGDASRYGLLETIREFARDHSTRRYDTQKSIREFVQDRLVDRTDLVATAKRHCDYYLALAKAARPELEGPRQAQWMRRLETELDNLRAGIALALAGSIDAVIAVKFEVALMRFRTLRGYSSEGRNNIRAALSLPEIREPTVARAHALYVGGALAINQGELAEAQAMLTECLDIHRTLGNPRETAAALSNLVTLHLQRGDVAKARQCAEEALDVFRKLGDRVGEAIGLLSLGEISVQQGDPQGASRLFEQCLGIARSTKHQELESDCERNLGEIALAAGDLRAAQSRFARALKVCTDAEDKRGAAIALWRLGKAEAAAGELDAAGKTLAEAMRALRAFEIYAEVLDCLEDYAKLLELRGEIENAVRVCGVATALREKLGLVRSPHREAEMRTRLDAARAALTADGFDAAWSDGRLWTLDEAIERALQPTPSGAAVIQ